MNKFVNKRIQKIKPSGIRRFFDAVHEIPDAISLGVGEPDFATPWEIRDAAIQSLRKGYTAYTSNSGLPALRREISAYLKERFSVEYGENEIIVTVGASEAIDLALRATVETDGEVLIPDPSYVSYAPCVTLAGGVPVPVKCRAEESFALTPRALERAITPRTRAVILPYPNNPTGTVLSHEQLQALCAVIRKHDLLVISDEIYAELTYGVPFYSPAAEKGMQSRTVLISGFSKAFAMTGWRVGYLCAPAPLIKQMLKIHQYTIMCAPTVGQYAALAALKCGRENKYADVEEMRRTYDQRRRFAVEALERMGLPVNEPKGAFYLFPSVKGTGYTGDTFAEAVLRDCHVAVVPGSSFGQAGKYHVRLSYATGIDTLREALKRIADWIECK